MDDSWEKHVNYWINRKYFNQSNYFTLIHDLIDTSDDFHWYCRCMRGNVFGSVCAFQFENFLLIVIEPPGATGQPEIDEVTNNTVTLNWDKPVSDGGSRKS